jgi:hypothetical protein
VVVGYVCNHVTVQEWLAGGIGRQNITPEQALQPQISACRSARCCPMVRHLVCRPCMETAKWRSNCMNAALTEVQRQAT